MKITKININVSEILVIFFSVLSVLFVYSGLIKGMLGPYIPGDLTLILILILAFTFAVYNIRKKITVSKTFRDCIIIFVLIIAMMNFSLFYTISGRYSLRKFIFFTLLNIGSFVFVYYFIKEKIISIEYIKSFLFFLSFILSLFFIYLYLNNNLYFYFYGVHFHNYPDYLALGSFLSVCIIMNLNKWDLLYIIHKLVCLSAIIILGGRGPILMLAIILIIYFMKNFNIRKISARIMVMFFIFIISFAVIMYKTDIAGRMISRFSKVVTTEGISSFSSRIELMKQAVKIITERPILGVGVGGFRQYVTNFDGRLYPHNIFLEVMSENGIFMGLLYMILFGYLFIVLIFKYEFSPDTFLVYLVCLFLFLNALKSSNLLDLRILFFWLGIYVGLIKDDKKKVKIFYNETLEMDINK